MTHLLADLRLAARSLARAPLFTFVAVVSIALGIGANTAVFTLLDQVALRPLPIQRPDELVQIHARGEENYGGGSGNGTELSWPMFRDFQDKAAGFAGIVGRVSTSMHVGHQGSSERVEGDMVSGNFFEVLGVGAALGRVFTPADDRTPGGHPLAVLGYDFWRRRFLGRADVVGQPVLINGQPFTVIGVAARGFYGLELGVSSDVYVPVTMQPQLGPAWLKIDDRRFRWVQVYARLQPGASAERAQAGLQPLFSAIRQSEAQEPGFERASSETRKQFLASQIHVDEARHGQASLQRELAPSLMILMAVAAGVLLIACANVANLLIARGAARERELALRRALGAGRGRLAWLLVAEALVLAAVGSVFGLLLATWGAGLLVDVFSTTDAPPPVTTSPDLRVVAFTTAIAILTALVSGLAPALRAAKGGVSAALKAAGGGVVREQPRLRKTLVVVQVALSFLMLATAGLFVRSLDNLLRVHPGFVTSQVTSFSVDLERSGYEDARSQQFARALHERLQALPGVDAAGLALFGILEGGGWGMALHRRRLLAQARRARRLHGERREPRLLRGAPRADRARPRVRTARRAHAAQGRGGLALPHGDRQRDLRQALLRRPRSDWPARRLRLRPGDADADADRRRGRRRQVHGDSRGATSADLRAGVREPRRRRADVLPAERAAARDDHRVRCARRSRRWIPRCRSSTWRRWTSASPARSGPSGSSPACRPHSRRWRRCSRWSASTA